MTADDVALVGAWIEAFVAEALPDEPPFDGRATAAGWLADPYRRLRLWVVDDVPVAMALAAWPTATGVRVSYVYTPPGVRGRGYGTAVTAAVSAEELAAGRTACFLYADLANPSSNAVYRRLGYEPVADVDRYRV